MQTPIVHEFLGEHPERTDVLLPLEEEIRARWARDFAPRKDSQHDEDQAKMETQREKNALRTLAHAAKKAAHATVDKVSGHSSSDPGTNIVEQDEEGEIGGERVEVEHGRARWEEDSPMSKIWHDLSV